MENSFINLGVSAPILKALEEMGFESATEVQANVIPHVLKHDDMIVMAKTGSGKTAAFGIPMLQMIEPDARSPKGLILTPTRELAVQVDNDLKQIAKHLPLRTAVVYGQHSMNLEVEALKRGASIVTGTPGRVFDHISQNTLETKHVRFLVLDEADRMLDMGFIDQVVRIIKTIPKDRITLLFSATIPTEVQKICKHHMKNPVTIEIDSDTKTVDTIRQMYYRVERNDKRTQLHRILMQEQPDSCMVFCNTRMEVDRVQEFLERKGYASYALHGEIPQNKRLKTIQGFKNAKFRLLVATDVAARGLHVDDLSLVINYDVPNEKDNYIHRIGRTGRAGNGGRAITMVTSEDIMSLYDIEEHIGAMIQEEDLPTDADLAACREKADVWLAAQTESHRAEVEIKSPRPRQEKSGRKIPPKGRAVHEAADPSSRGHNQKPAPERSQSSGQQGHQRDGYRPRNASETAKANNRIDRINTLPAKEQPASVAAAVKPQAKAAPAASPTQERMQEHHRKEPKSFIQRMFQRLRGTK